MSRTMSTARRRLLTILAACGRRAAGRRSPVRRWPFRFRAPGPFPRATGSLGEPGPARRSGTP